jgi:tRNA nucleotidyltransferase (CCA-adding enzyme)
MPGADDTTARLEAARAEVPAPLRAALNACEEPGYLVGGAIRDALMKVPEPGPDLDIAIEGELDPVLDRLGMESRSHERFGTAKVLIDGRAVDLTRTRRETYAHPGALPDVEPAPLATDLERRDFSINAMALPLDGPAELIDPFGGAADLRNGVLRLLHPGSITDDPTRVFRGARYAARLGLEPDPETRALFAAADLSTVSGDRVEAELLRIGAEPEAVGAFALLDEWGVLDVGDECLELMAEAAEYALTDPWVRIVERPTLLATIATAQPEVLSAASRLAEVPADRPTPELFERASGSTDLELAIARAKGAEWLDRHVSEWRRVALTIDGDTLIAAGVREGPDVGRGLKAALHARLDGSIGATPEEELGVALAAVGAA